MDVYAVHNSVVTVIFSFWKSTCYVPPYSVFVRLCLLFQSLLLLTHTKFICIFMMYSHIEYQMPSSSRLLIIISVNPEAKYRCNAVAYLQKKTFEKYTYLYKTCACANHYRGAISLSLVVCPPFDYW